MKSNKPWSSVYVECDARHVVSEGGFDSNPYLTPRWSRAPQETYGRSPAMNMLPTIKVVNAMTRTVLMAGELAVAPPITVPANGMEGPVRIAPRSINYMRAGTRERPEPMMTGSNPGIGMEMIAHEEKKIQQAFFYDAFKLPELDRMTAEEVITRRQQGLIVASPMISRLYEEWLTPVVAATFQWMKKSRRFLDPPAIIAGRRLSPHYVSPMSISQRASESQNFMQAMQTASPLLTANPDAFQNIDSDAALREIFAMFNSNPRFLRRANDVKAIRQSQAQQQAIANQVAMVQGGAKAARDAAAGFKDVSDARAG
jgi:hypothetical protein